MTSVIDAVRVGGEAAVLDIGERFDGIRPTSLRFRNRLLTRPLPPLIRL